MNDPAPAGPAADGIEEGKRLVRVGGDHGLSLADRLAERFRWIAWRTPLHTLRLRGRFPLKLLAVADDPFLGDPRRGQAMLDGMLSFRGEVVNLPAIDLAKPAYSPAFADYLHSFMWLRDLSTVTTRAVGAPIAEGLMRKWLDAHGEVVADPAWRADLWGKRILFWVAHAPLILSSTDLVYRSRVLNGLARGARHLDRTADRAPAGPRRIAACAGIVAAGLMIPGGDARRALDEAGLARAIAASVGSDGGVTGRSPLGLIDAIMLLTMLRATYAARRIDPPELIDATLARMVGALQGLTLGDGALSSWQGGNPVAADQVAAIVEATGVRTRPLRQARDWGYHRLAAGQTVLVIDAAPPPVARLVEGGCASTLAFELSDGTRRLVVNCGGARSVHASVPASLTEGLRTTAAHSTLIVDDSNSTAIHGDGTLGRGVASVELSRQDGGGTARLDASHDGYVRRYGLIHRRQLLLSADGRDLRGEDLLIPAGKKRQRGDIPFAIRFHLAPGIEVSPTTDNQAAFLRLPGGAVWQFRCREATLAVDDSLWVDGAGRPHATRQIVLSGQSPPGGASVTWLFHRAK
ncbi:heparinase II/III family protein [Sphingomonas sp. SFZ2018-12]|uniref:heparinase II/III family protein n=1 Tax=Sphingomonas sp. SFZ2018-12 TaxID=2683197 RepID=UPI001F0E65DB